MRFVPALLLSLACLSFDVAAQVDVLDPLVFDLDYYSARNPDVRTAFEGNADAIRSHWVTWGIREGRTASPIFDVKYYLSANPDLTSAFGNFYDLAITHYLQRGIFEGRAVSPVLDLRYYTQSNVDIARAFPGDFRSAAMHYLRNGMFEGRTASRLFDVRYYLSANADLRRAFVGVSGTNYGAATLHWLMFGINERRPALTGQTPSTTLAPTSTPPNNPTNQFPIAAAWSAFQQSAHNYTLTTTDAQNNSYTLQLNVTPGANGTFRGQSTSTSSSSVIMTSGATVSASSSTEYFLSSPYTFVASADSQGECDVGRDQHALPPYATVGQSGAFYAYDTFSSCEVPVWFPISPSSRTTAVWSLRADSPTTAWFCVVSSWVSAYVSSYRLTGTECYKVDQSGNVSALTIAVTVDGVTLNFQ